MQYTIFTGLVAFFLTLFSILVMRPVATHIKLVDKPNSRKLHEGHIPLIGGIGVLFGMSIALLMSRMSLEHYRVLLAACAIVAFFGVLDDLHELSPHFKLWVQIFVAFLIVIFGHASVANLGNLLFMGDIHLGLFSIPFSIIAVIGIINAVNMLDGMDGLMGSITFIQFLLLALIAYFTQNQFAQNQFDFMFLLIVRAALIGFLCLNFPVFKRRALVFMGDTGSMLIGLLLVWFLMTMNSPTHVLTRPITFVWIMAFPIYDMVNVVYRRLRKGKSPFHADREHFHHIFQKSGISNAKIVILLLIFSTALSLAGIILALFKVSEPYMFILFMLGFVLYLFFINHADYAVKKYRAIKNKCIL